MRHTWPKRGTDGFDWPSPTVDSLGSARDSQRVVALWTIERHNAQIQKPGPSSKKKKEADHEVEPMHWIHSPGLAPHAGVRFPGRADWCVRVQRAGAIRRKFSLPAAQACANLTATMLRAAPLRQSTRAAAAIGDGRTASGGNRTRPVGPPRSSCHPACRS